MKRKKIFLILVAVLAVLVLSACGGGAADAPADQAAVEEHSDGDEHAEATTGEHNDGEEHGDAAADGEHEHFEAPDEFASLTNPFVGDAAAVEAGKVIYANNCAACHGATGQGDGPSAAALDPRPSNLADPTMMNSMTDSYLFWRISEGGVAAPFNSQMPPWKGVLSEEEIWQVITFVRTLSGE